jgi:hypothetical protein
LMSAEVRSICQLWKEAILILLLSITSEEADAAAAVPFFTITRIP